MTALDYYIKQRHQSLHREYPGAECDIIDLIAVGEFYGVKRGFKIGACVAVTLCLVISLIVR